MLRRPLRNAVEFPNRQAAELLSDTFSLESNVR